MSYFCVSSFTSALVVASTSYCYCCCRGFFFRLKLVFEKRSCSFGMLYKIMSSIPRSTKGSPSSLGCEKNGLKEENVNNTIQPVKMFK